MADLLRRPTKTVSLQPGAASEPGNAGTTSRNGFSVPGISSTLRYYVSSVAGARRADASERWKRVQFGSRGWVRVRRGSAACGMRHACGEESMGSERVTLSQYRAVEKCMPYGEVVRLLGRAGTLDSRTDGSDGPVVASYYWWNDNNSYMEAAFKEDRLIYKDQSRLGQSRTGPGRTAPPRSRAPRQAGGSAEARGRHCQDEPVPEKGAASPSRSSSSASRARQPPRAAWATSDPSLLGDGGARWGYD